MKPSKTLRPAGQVPSTGLLLLGAAAALAALAAGNQLLARRAERRHPAHGKFIEVDGVRLHYLEAGSGAPVVLIHGNGVAAEDFVVSGLFDRLGARHRVIAFDRPGFGYSDRPRSRIWTATAQAELLAGALDRIGVGRATVIGHSWGTLVALRLALQRPERVAGLGLISGYYWPTPRLDVPMMSGPAIPGAGDILRFTLSPLLGRLMAPVLFRQLFSPAKVTEAFKAGFPTSMALRPGQIRASAGDTALMPVEAMKLSKLYKEIACPVVLIAGEGDKIASYRHQSAKLARALGWELHTVHGAGHMAHHTALPEVAAELETLITRVEATPATRSPEVAGAPLEGVSASL
ncbi:MAG TPA: alpha/beta hydrolase [Phenylobacterium sp.]|jgi:pimeloyl-ACP methyl ester carboxylesterase